MPRPVHFEIHASDPQALVDFYSEVFGWSFAPVPQMDYWLIDTGQGVGINGGMNRRRGPAPAPDAPVSAFVVTIGVDDLDATLAKALAAGAATALPKMAITGVGWQAYIKDPDGNILGLHQPDPKAA